MNAKVRVTLEVIVAVVLSYFICQYFGWNLFDSKYGIHGGAFGLIVLVLMGLFEGVVLWRQGEFKNKPKSDDFTNLR